MPLTDVFTTRAEAAEIAWTMACRGNSEVASGLLIPDVEAMIDVAVRRTHDRVFKNDSMFNEWQRLQKERTMIAINGSGEAILDAAVIPESVLPRFKGQVRHSDTTNYPRPFEWIETPDELRYPQKIKKFGFYCLVGGNSAAAVLLLADGNGSLITTGTLTVRACEYYTFDDMSEQLRDDFLFTLAEMARAKFIAYIPGGGNAQQSDQQGSQ